MIRINSMGFSPLTARALIAAHLAFNGVFKVWFPISVRRANLHCTV
jgi:hypothetical protein